MNPPKKHTPILILLVVLLVVNVVYAEQIQWIEDFKVALEEARKIGKPMLIYFYSDTCIYCSKFEKNTLSNPEIIDLISQNFIAVRIDAQKLVEISYYFKVTGTPTLYILLPNGTLVDNKYWKKWHPGYMTVEELKEYLLISLEIAGDAGLKIEDQGFQKPTENATAVERHIQDRKTSLLLTLPLVFGAGVVSAFSPCILPLLPIFVSLQLRSDRKKALLVNAGFIINLSILGMLIGNLGNILLPMQSTLERIAYIVIIAMGFLLVSDRLNRYFIKTTFSLTSIAGKKLEKTGGYAGGFMTGFLLGFLWSPCIGPMLGSVLACVIIIGGVLEGFLIMLVYAIGFAASIFILARIIEKADQKIKSRKRKKEKKIMRRKMARRGRLLEKIAGILLIGLGLLMLSGYGKQLLSYIPAF